MEDFSKALERPMKPPKGWRKAMSSDYLCRGAGGWLATVVPHDGGYRLVIGRHEGKRVTKAPQLPEGFLLRMTRLGQVIAVREFDCADEAMSIADGVMG